MSDHYKKLYNNDFYETHAAGMSHSATIVLGQVYKLFSPKSVIDIGCGQGAWLSAAESLGATTLKGHDGDWVIRKNLFSKNIDFVPANLADSLPKLNMRYDLCISLEVAEHLPEERAESFVDLLCLSSDTILFGAAIRYQGGTNHINEQWQSYWIKLFNARGYECIDCIRGAIWNDMSVEWWYKQNTFIFIGPNSMLQPRTEELRASERPIFDVAHPINYENKIRAYENKIRAYEDRIRAYENRIN
jgi:SAM-dependent methyltransferase